MLSSWWGPPTLLEVIATPPPRLLIKATRWAGSWQMIPTRGLATLWRGGLVSPRESLLPVSRAPDSDQAAWPAGKEQYWVML